MSPDLASALAAHSDDFSWEYSDGEEGRDDVIRWKTFCGGKNSTTKGFSFGIFEVPPDAVLDAHHHADTEAYYIVRGSGDVLLDNRVVQVRAGSVLYTPENLVHGVRNSGTETLELLWIFPVDSYSEVTYHMEKENNF